MNAHKKTIGILGFGKTGQSFLRYFSTHQAHIIVFDPSPLSLEQEQLLFKNNVVYEQRNCTAQDLLHLDQLAISPGVHLDPITLPHNSKIISELDLFSQELKTKTVAVTGSLGKTTIVTLLTTLLNRLGIKARALGNIGIPLLDGLKTQNEYDLFVLELSSFQLERSRSFAPDTGLITNLYPNHLDRHGTIENYADAKARLFAYQKGSHLTFVGTEGNQFFKKSDRTVALQTKAAHYKPFITPELKKITFEENWIALFSLLEHQGIKPEDVIKHAQGLHIPEHRCELLGTYAGITFYNDSKSTIPEATLATIKALSEQQAPSLILFLGGISKNVDRAQVLRQLPKTIKHVFCFGKEAHELAQICCSAGLSNSAFSTLDSAWKSCCAYMKTGDSVLFSPAGASYDLFKNYEERGTYFKELVCTFDRESKATFSPS